MENMTIEEINKEIARLSALREELRQQENKEKEKAIAVYIGQYVKFKNNPCKIGRIYKVHGDFLCYKYLEFDKKYFEFISEDGLLCELEDVDFITKDEFKNMVMSWVGMILNHYYDV